MIGVRLRKKLSALHVQSTGELTDGVGEIDAHPLEVSVVVIRLSLIKGAELCLEDTLEIEHVVSPLPNRSVGSDGDGPVRKLMGSSTVTLID